MSEKRYPSDLNRREWAVIQPLFPRRKRKGGRPPKHSKKDVVNGILYVLRTGCQWYALPKDYYYCVKLWHAREPDHPEYRLRDGSVDLIILRFHCNDKLSPCYRTFNRRCLLMLQGQRSVAT